MADHPFRGTWTSYRINDVTNLPLHDGTIDLDIKPNGTFVSGKHTPHGSSDGITLKNNSISETEIELEEESGDFRLYRGRILSDYGAPTSVVLGRFITPPLLRAGTPRDPKADQEQGDWVGTKP
jgi:hypothetical protein